MKKKMRIKKGDNVIVISGKDKGKKGKISRAIPEEEAVVIEGVNVRKKHQKAKKSGQKGQIVNISLPIHVSNVQIIDSKTGKPTRIGIKEEGGKKIRYAKKSDLKID